MLRKTVPDPYSGDWKSSVAVYESGTGNRRFMRQNFTKAVPLSQHLVIALPVISRPVISTSLWIIWLVVAKAVVTKLLLLSCGSLQNKPNR